MRCPDGGACHHECVDTCFRVRCCAPLSNVFPNDEWPADVKAAHGRRDYLEGSIVAYEGKPGCSDPHCRRIPGESGCRGWHCAVCDHPSSMYGHKACREETT